MTLETLLEKTVQVERSCVSFFMVVLKIWVGNNLNFSDTFQCHGEKIQVCRESIQTVRELLICAYLLFAKVFKTALEILEYYGSKRTFDSKGVTIPSQRRYVDYFSTKISQKLQYNPVKLMLTSIVLEPPPYV